MTILPIRSPRRRAASFTSAIFSAGLLLGAFTSGARAQQNLIRNGGFESGYFTDWSSMPAGAGSDFGVFSLAGANAVGNGFFFGIPVSIAPAHGTFAAYFGPVAGQFDTISQSFHTISGPYVRGVYRTSFRLGYLIDPVGFSGPGQFRAFWDSRVVYLNSGFNPFPYQQIVLHEVADGRTSTLGFQGLGFPPFYTLDDVSVKLVGLDFNLSQLTPNQRAVAKSLTNAASDRKFEPLGNLLTSLPGRDVPSALDRIAPEELTSIFAISNSYATVQALNLQRRTDDIRSGSNGFSAAGLAINGVGPSYSGAFGPTGPVSLGLRNSDDGKEVKETKQVAPAEQRWGAFLSGTGEWVNVSGTDNARGYDLTSGGFTLGVDYKVCSHCAIGLALGYTGTTADLTDHGRVWLNGGKIGFYATMFENPTAPAPAPGMSKDSSKDSSKEAPAPAAVGGGWYVDMAAFGGYNGYETRRAALEGDARGSTHGGEVDALFGAGYDFKSGALTFGPTASFNYTYAGINGFTEHDSLLPLNIRGGDAESLRTAFGFKISYELKIGGMLLKPELRAAWQHEFGDSTYALDSSFANGMGTTFTASGPRLGRDSALLGAGAALQVSDRVAVYLYYDGEIGRTNYESTSVTGGIRVSF